MSSRRAGVQPEDEEIDTGDDVDEDAAWAEQDRVEQAKDRMHADTYSEIAAWATAEGLAPPSNFTDEMSQDATVLRVGFTCGEVAAEAVNTVGRIRVRRV